MGTPERHPSQIEIGQGERKYFQAKAVELLSHPKKIVPGGIDFQSLSTEYEKNGIAVQIRIPEPGYTPIPDDPFNATVITTEKNVSTAQNGNRVNKVQRYELNHSTGKPAYEETIIERDKSGMQTTNEVSRRLVDLLENDTAAWLDEILKQEKFDTTMGNNIFTIERFEELKKFLETLTPEDRL